MTNTKARLLKSVYNVTFSVLTVIVGALFIWQVWSMYLSAGNKPAYSVERIATYFGQISAPVFCWLVSLLGNILLDLIFPDPTQKVKAYVDTTERLRNMQKRLPKDYDTSKIDVWDGLRTAFWVLTFAECIFTAILALSHLFNENYIPIRTSAFFTEHHAVVDRLAFILILSLSCAVSVIIANGIDVLATKKQTALLQKAFVENKGKLLPPAQNNVCKCKAAMEKFFESKAFILSTRITIAVIGVVFVIWGICNGGLISVLDKAINICTQCIGLG